MSGLRLFEPSADHPWDRAAAAHLLRRAGFAPAEHEVQAALAAGLEATVERLVGADRDSPRHDELDALGRALATRNNIERLREWWLHRMRHTKRPLHARMALLWHDHFATSNVKVRSAPMMLQQLRLFERHALGRFDDLLLAVARDPAMIVWLDGDENSKGRPNENFARELFELFSLGVGNYTEADIREAARGFTGWHQRDGRFRFVGRVHDRDAKTLFGESGPFDGTDIVRLTVDHPACSRFIAGKLLREFLCPAPPDPLVEALAARLRETRFDLAATLKTLLASEAMFDPRWYRARIKSPVEFAVGLARSLELRAPKLSAWVSQMGQRLFEPPSVKGWDGHRAWINSTTMLVRLNAALGATEAHSEDIFLDPSALRGRYGLDDAAAVVRFCEQLALDGRVPAGLHARLSELNDPGDETFRRALRLLLASPEYQLA